MSNTAYYTSPGNKYLGGAYHCDRHSMSFDIRCVDCVVQFKGDDPDVIILDGKIDTKIAEIQKLY